MRSHDWSDPVLDILAGDHVVVLVHRTPAGGVVLTPLTNCPGPDRASATVTVNSSVGAPRKLQRIAADPRVALPYHTRRHSRTDRPEFVFVQGEARVSAAIEDYPAHLGEVWDRYDGAPATGPLWRRWLRIYHTRSEIIVSARRTTVSPDLTGRQGAQVLGTSSPAALPQTPPGPRHRATGRPPEGGRSPRSPPARAPGLGGR